MFKNVVWATDGSAAADLGLPYVQQLAEEGAKIVVVHCQEFVVGPKSSGYTVHADEDELQAKIKRQARELREQGHEVGYRLTGSAAGGAAHKIADVARDEGADLIVVGTRGHTAIGGLLLGSVTQRLLHIGACPVLAVPAVRVTAKSEPEVVQAAG
jgi:nucleotide-binding universal stress UspA family protein